MALGVWLNLTERHSHAHTHEVRKHQHVHCKRPVTAVLNAPTS